MEYVNACKFKKIVILKLQNVIKRLEEGYSLYDTLLDLSTIIRRIKESS